MVCNHQAFQDVYVHGCYQLPSFIMKQDAHKIPTITQQAKIGQCLTVSNDPVLVASEIKERQELAQEGKTCELIIHAEGGTTNGNLIGFKKGAFANLMSIRPKSLKYNTFGMVSPGSGILDGLPHHVLAAANVFSVVELNEMPIFRPNEYFWKNHQREGEEKWQTYARVIRDIISEAGNIPIVKHEDGTEIDIREKSEYKNILWPRKSRSKDTDINAKKKDE